MAEGILEHAGDLLNLFSKAAPALKGDIQVADGVHNGGWENLDSQLKSGASAAQIEISDGSSDIAETKSRTAIALAKARLQRHEQFKQVVVPTLLRMMKNSGKNKVICAAFALAGLHVVQALNRDFNLSALVDTSLIAAGTYFGYEVAKENRHSNTKHTALAATDLESVIEEVRKLDRKATIKLASLVALNFYDSPPLTQAAVLTSIGVIATVLPYALILGIKYADMKGLDWQTWEGESRTAKLWQKTHIPALIGTTLISLEKSAQTALPYLGRTAKAVASGRLIIKGLSMFAPLEAGLDQLLEHRAVLYELGVRGIAWGATGLVAGYATYPIVSKAKIAASELFRPTRPAQTPELPLPVNLQRAALDECLHS